MRGHRLDLDELHPGLEIRVGLGACERFQVSYFLLITEIGDQTDDGRIWLEGDRMTLHGRVVEHIRVCVRTTHLHPRIIRAIERPADVTLATSAEVETTGELRTDL